MKNTRRTLPLLLLIAVVFFSAFGKPAPEKDFQRFAERQDSLMVDAYFKRNISVYQKLLSDLEQRYDRLPAGVKKENQHFLSGAYYNFACLYALENQPDAALDCLEKSIRNGYTDYSHIRFDKDLDSIRNTPRFMTLVQPLRAVGDYLYILRKANAYNPREMQELPAFTYQPASDSHLVALRNAFNLDSIAGEGNELSRFTNLLHWVHELIPHDGAHSLPEVRNAMGLVQACKAGNRGLNCRGLATVLNEAYLALGYGSRLITCLPKDSLHNDPDCHVITMVYSRSMKKWLWMDPTWDAYVMDENGVMLGPEEVRERLILGLPLAISPGANWNHRQAATVPDYLENYMAKNLYMLECAVSSESDLETKKEGKVISYILLMPLDYREEKPGVKESKSSSGNGLRVYYTSNPAVFWSPPPGK